MKNIRKNLIFDRTSGKIRESKLEMTSFRTVLMTSPLFCFEEFLAYTVFLPSFIVVRHQMAELTREGGFFAPVQYRGSPVPVR